MNDKIELFDDDDVQQAAGRGGKPSVACLHILIKIYLQIYCPISKQLCL